MSDSRRSPIPQDRVYENADQAGRAQSSKEEQRRQDRWVEDQGVDERPGTNARQQPGVPDEAAGAAEGGD